MVRKALKSAISGFFVALLDDQPTRPGRFQVADPKTLEQWRIERLRAQHDRRVRQAYQYAAKHPEEFSPARLR